MKAGNEKEEETKISQIDQENKLNNLECIKVSLQNGRVNDGRLLQIPNEVLI